MKISLPSNIAQYVDAMGRPTPDYYRWLKQVDEYGTRLVLGLPPGGATGQIPYKASVVDGDVVWHTLVKADVELSKVDNTSDEDKPVSTATQTALNAKANTADLGSAAYAETTAFDGSGVAAAAVAAHVAAPDPHPQYLTATEGNAAYQPLSTNLTAWSAKTVPTGATVGTTDSQALTNKNLAGAGNTFPTFNQNTTGSAAKLTTARTINGTAFDGTANITITTPLPTRTNYTSGSGTYSTPANCRQLRIRMLGAGGGGAGGGTSGGTGGAGGNTTFGTSLLTANGGNGGAGAGSSSGGVGGTATGGSLNLQGGSGGSAQGIANGNGGQGAASPFGGSGNLGTAAGAAGAARGPGSGGGGGGNGSGATGGGGGAAGGYLEAIITSPASTYSYAVGTGGTAGTAGTNGNAGAAGGAGLIIIDEIY